MRERPINTNKGLLFAAIALGGSIACGPSGPAREQPTPEPQECPSGIAEVSYLVGGNPEEWKAVSDVPGAWVFRSEREQVFTGPSVGRLYDPNGRTPRGIVARTNFTWYVCPSDIRFSPDPS